MITKIIPEQNGMFSIYDNDKLIGTVSAECLPLFLNADNQNDISNQSKYKTIEDYDKMAEMYIDNAIRRRLSKNTIRNYTNQLKYFRDFFSEKYNGKPTHPPTYNDLIDYRNHLIDKGSTVKSVKNILTTLQIFFKWSSQKSMGDDKYLDDVPIDKYMFPREKKYGNQMSDHFLDAKDVELMWMNRSPCDKGIAKRKWNRNYAMTTLLLDAKIRNDELINLRLKDIDFNNKTIFIAHGKGDKPRIVQITDISITAIQMYLKSGDRPDYCTADDYLFGTCAENKYQGKQSGSSWHKASNVWLSSTVERHIKSVTGKSGYRTHSLRHTGAVMDLRNGMSLERLKEELGHSSITTTEIYAPSIGTINDCNDAINAYKERDKQAMLNKKKLDAMSIKPI